MVSVDSSSHKTRANDLVINICIDNKEEKRKCEATFKSSTALRNSCLIRLNCWKEDAQVYVSSKPIFNFPFSRHSLRFTLFVYC